MKIAVKRQTKAVNIKKMNKRTILVENKICDPTQRYGKGKSNRSGKRRGHYYS